MKVLIVEDNPISQKVLKISFQNEGYESFCTQNVAEAMDCLKENSDIDVIIADIQLPQLSGLDLLKYIKQNQKTKNIPVVMCTSHKDVGTIQKAIKLGCEYYLVKPLNLEKLQKKVKEIVNTEEGTEVLEEQTEEKDNL